uniref:Uncharacterized protein n=1 Tax=Steinernema glaseri TaxID=37863 RepID=A0A1I7Y722_9BILA
MTMVTSTKKPLTPMSLRCSRPKGRTTPPPMKHLRSTKLPEFLERPTNCVVEQSLPQEEPTGHPTEIVILETIPPPQSPSMSLPESFDPNDYRDFNEETFNADVDEMLEAEGSDDPSTNEAFEEHQTTGNGAHHLLSPGQQAQMMSYSASSTLELNGMQPDGKDGGSCQEQQQADHYENNSAGSETPNPNATDGSSPNYLSQVMSVTGAINGISSQQADILIRQNY